MKKIIVILVSVFQITISFSILKARTENPEKPIINQEYTIKYNPNTNQIFHNPDRLLVYYVFDYWDSPFTKKSEDKTIIQRCQNSIRKKIVNLFKRDSIWETVIPISPVAKILSYVITDGTKFDSNHDETYYSNVLAENKKPVRESSLFLSQLFGFTNRPFEMQLSEIKKELEYYPADFTAYYFYWQIYLYKNLYKKESIDSVIDRMQSLYNLYPENPEICNLLVKVYTSGLLKKEKVFEIISQIPSRNVSEEFKWSLDNEKRAVAFTKRYQSLLNSKAYDFKLKDKNKTEITLSENQGKVVLLYFWRYVESFKFCKSSLDSIQLICNKFRDKDFRVYIIDFSTQLRKIFISVTDTSKDGQESKILQLIKEHNYSFIFLEGYDALRDEYCSSFYDFYLIDKKGFLRYMTNQTNSKLFEQLRSQILKLLMN